MRPDDRKYWVDSVIEIVKAQMIDMVVIDPITRFLALASENDNMEVLGAMMEMERIATEGNCGLLMLHHTGKAGGQARGASAFLQNVDVILTLRKARDGEEISEAANPETVRVLEGTGRFDEIVSRMGLWYEDAEYHGTDHVGAVRPMNPQGDDADAILQWIKMNTPIPTTLEADQFNGFEKNQIMEGVDMKGSR
ncbi:MAG: AAA family ATPase, partial [Actinomycetales bacterium]|nr:AAA family ATPase [Actinomycetales bacterium]